MADWMWMPFGLLVRLGPRMRQVIGINDCFRQRSNFGVDMGCPIVTKLCEVREATDLPFGW